MLPQARPKETRPCTGLTACSKLTKLFVTRSPVSGSSSCSTPSCHPESRLTPRQVWALAESLNKTIRELHMKTMTAMHTVMDKDLEVHGTQLSSTAGASYLQRPTTVRTSLNFSPLLNAPPNGSTCCLALNSPYSQTMWQSVIIRPSHSANCLLARSAG